MPLWFYNLAAYCAQLAMLIAAGALMVTITRLREPRLRLIYWEVLLAIGVLLPAIEPWQTTAQIDQGKVPAVGIAAHAGRAGIEAAAALPAHATSSFTIYEIVAISLVAGLLIRLLWLAAGLVRLRRSRLHARPLGPHAAVEQFKATLNVSPAVLVSDRISSPVTFGWRAPRVLLPQKFILMDEARQRAILCHEFLHVRRRDWLWHVAEEILRSLFWFHLAVAWLIAQIRLCREQLVDREVVLLAGSRRDYLDALFEIASSSRTFWHAPALLFLSERHLKRRVKFILKEVTMSRKKLALALSASLGGLILTGVVAATLIPLRTSAAQASSESSMQTPTVRPDTHFYGNPNASVTVVEFGDFQCPACREAASVAEQVRKNMAGQVRFAYRQFPLTRFHHQAEKAAEATECAAGQGKFWQAVNYLSDHPLDFSSDGVRQFAASLGLDQARTMRCLSSGAMAGRVQQDISDGHALGVRSVPTFFIDNTMVVGLQSYSRLHTLIEQKLRADGNIQSTTSNSSNVLSATSLAPALAEGLNGQATGTPPQKSSPAADPAAHNNESSSTSAKAGHSAYINQEEIQRQLDEAMKQAEIAQDAASKIDQAKLQQQVEQAMEQAKLAQKSAAKVNKAEIQRQLDEAMKPDKIAQEAASKLGQKKLQEQIDQAMKQLKMAEVHTPKIDDAKINQEIEQAMKQGQMAQGAVPKIDQKKLQEQIEQAMKQHEKMNTPEMRRQMQEQMEQLKNMNTPEKGQQLKQATEQAKIVQAEAAKVNQAETQRRLRQAPEELKATRKQLEKAEEQLKKQQLEMQKQRKEADPVPPVPPQLASPSPDKVEPPAPPPASPQPPPVPPSSDKLTPPPNPPPASPAPPSPPQN